MKKAIPWSEITATSFAIGLIVQFLTAHYYTVVAGNEIWVEIAFVVLLTASTWLLHTKERI